MTLLLGETGPMDRFDPTELYDFGGKTVFITGGNGALGGVIAVGLVQCGADVAILVHRRSVPDTLIGQLHGGPGRYVCVSGDVLKRDTLLEAFETAVSHFGPVDILVNAAGGNRPEAVTRGDRAFFDLPEDAVRFVFDLNLLGTLLPSQVVGRQMAERQEGAILNIASMAALSPLTRVPAFSAAKAGVVNFTRWLAVYMAQEYSPAIRVNALAPGFFIGEQNRALLLNEDSTLTARGKTIIEHTPMGRFGNPRDLLGAALWLLSPAAAFVTGIVVPVDGGFSAQGGV